jgi:hypothetical protein
MIWCKWTFLTLSTCINLVKGITSLAAWMIAPGKWQADGLKESVYFSKLVTLLMTLVADERGRCPG